MNSSICGVDCNICQFKETCGGCIKTKGKPFNKPCMVAECCIKKNNKSCSQCNSNCGLKSQIIKEFNSLNVKDMPKITELYSLKGSYVNLEYTLINGQTIKFWDNDKIYLGCQVCKPNSDRCYGLTADENNLLVCEYGENGKDPEIIIYKKRDL